MDKFEDVRVGSEFYLPYMFWGRNSRMNCLEAFGSNAKVSKEYVLSQVKLSIIHSNFPDYKLTDKFKLITKFKFHDCFKLNPEFRRADKVRERREFVKIKNLRTNKIKELSDEWIDSFLLFCFDTI